VRLFGCSSAEFQTFLDEVERLGFGDVSRDDHGNVTLQNRRMQRDVQDREKLREQWRNRQQRRRGQEPERGSSRDDHAESHAAGHADVTPIQPLESQSQSQILGDPQIPGEGSFSLSGSPDRDHRDLPTAKRATTWPATLVLTPDMRAYALGKGVEDPDAEFAAWRDDCSAHGRKYVDWVAAWRERVRRAPEFNGRRSGGGAGAPAPARLTPGMARLAADYKRTTGGADGSTASGVELSRPGQDRLSTRPRPGRELRQ